MSPNDADGMLCLCCQQPIDAGEGFSCPSCGAPHHQACWEKTGGCSSQSCPSRRPVGVPEQTLPPPPPISGQPMMPTMPMGDFTPVELGLGPIFNIAWARFIQHIGPLIVGVLIYFVISVVLSKIPIIKNLSVFVLAPIIGGLAILSLKAVNDRNPDYGDTFLGFERYLYWLGLALLKAVIGLACAIPVIITSIIALVGGGASLFSQQNPFAIFTIMGPGIVIGLVLTLAIAIPVFVRLMFANYLMAEGAGIIESLQGSWAMTQGRGLQLFGIAFVLILTAIAGAIACLVGLFFTMPLALTGFAALYNAVKTEQQQVGGGQPLLR